MALGKGLVGGHHAREALWLLGTEIFCLPRIADEVIKRPGTVANGRRMAKRFIVALKQNPMPREFVAYGLARVVNLARLSSKQRQ